MIFDKARIISCQEQAAVFRFRKKATLPPFKKAVLYVCGMGVAQYRINGKKFTDDLFTAPVSDYAKTMWVNKYDVSSYVHAGENIFFVALGNGFINEGICSSWHFDTSDKRDEKQFFFLLVLDGKIALSSDETWLCSADPFTTYCEYRSGEYVDYNFFEENESLFDYDDSAWHNAVYRDRFTAAKRKLCRCEPIREDKILQPIAEYRTKDGSTVFDFGSNVAGYIRLRYTGEKGEILTIRYAEDFNGDDIDLHGMNKFYPRSPLQTDQIVCSGKTFDFSPRFTYKGFRYVKISGNRCPVTDISSVELRQQVKRAATFSSNNELLNKLYEMAIHSTYANMFYSLTDCPTREKLGWTNDAAVSLEHVFLNFKAKKFLQKWYEDIADTQREDGAICAIAPTFSDFGYDCGPVADICFFTLPSAFEKYYGDDSLIRKHYEKIAKYYDYMTTQHIFTPNIDFWVYDWDGTTSLPTDKKYIEYFLAREMQNALIHFAEISGDESGKARFVREREETTEKLRAFTDGKKSLQNTVFAVATLFAADLGDKKTLMAQMKDIFAAENGNPKIGALGLKYFFDMCFAAGETQFAVDWLTNENATFAPMAKKGDTLWECQDFSPNRYSISMNHHMYSAYCTILIKGVLGLYTEDGKTLRFSPVRCAQVDKVQGGAFIRGKKVTASIDWKKGTAKIDVPAENIVEFRGDFLKKGKQTLNLL